MSAYKHLNMTNAILRTVDGAQILPDLSNGDYQEYLAWLGAGNHTESADPLPAREITLSPSQQIILADGVDMAQVIIAGEPGATVEYTVNGGPFSETLNETGSETIELTCDTPNTTLVVQAGTARAVVYAVEVPA